MSVQYVPNCTNILTYDMIGYTDKSICTARIDPLLDRYYPYRAVCSSTMNLVCNTSKQISITELPRRASLNIWDEELIDNRSLLFVATLYNICKVRLDDVTT